MLLRTEFKSDKELIDFFFNLKNRVPARNAKLHKERQIKIEIFCIQKYLLTLSHYNLLTYPVEVIQQESPDFKLIFDNNTQGIEITESTERSYQKFLTNISGKKGVYMRNKIGYSGNEPEISAVSAILESFSQKSIKLHKYKEKHPDINTYGLLIYENQCELPLDTDEILEILRNELPQAHNTFQNISIISGGYLISNINSKGLELFEIPELVVV